jgi:hypothetical protein
MVIYLAGGYTPLSDRRKELALARSMSQAHPIYARLVSFYPYSEQMLENVLSLKDQPDITEKMEIKIMYDSGAFSAKKHDITIDIDDYIPAVRKHVDKLDYYVNLDVIGDGETSYQNYLYMRSEGLAPIPVYHLNTPIKYLEFYMEQTDYIGIGADNKWITASTRHTLDYLFRKYFTDSAGFPIIKVHALGLSSIPILRRYPWHSADTTAPFQNSFRGSVVIPRKRNGKYRYDMPPKIVSISPRKLRASNHISNLSADDRKAVLNYMAEKVNQLVEK